MKRVTAKPAGKARIEFAQAEGEDGIAAPGREGKRRIGTDMADRIGSGPKGASRDWIGLPQDRGDFFPCRDDPSPALPFQGRERWGATLPVRWVQAMRWILRYSDSDPLPLKGGGWEGVVRSWKKMCRRWPLATCKRLAVLDFGDPSPQSGKALPGHGNAGAHGIQISSMGMCS
jgi:hypothetical protein